MKTTLSLPKDSTLLNSKSIKNRTRGSLDIRNHGPNILGRKPARLQGCQLFLHLHRFFCARPLYWHSEKSPFILNNRTRSFFGKSGPRPRHWMWSFQPAIQARSRLFVTGVGFFSRVFSIFQIVVVICRFPLALSRDALEKMYHSALQWLFWNLTDRLKKKTTAK